MPFNSESRYPTRRTYVVKMRSDASGGMFSGRFENLVTGTECEFSSGRELLESIAADLENSTEKSHHRDRSATQSFPDPGKLLPE